MADYGIKVSRTGDVKSATLLNQTFNSQKNCLKIASEGSSSSTASGSRTVEVAHGLSFTPTFLVWFDVNSSGDWYSVYNQEFASSKDGIVDASTDGTNLYLVISTSASATVRCYYVLFADPGA
tara:strand:+ start:429 stop:797 length:369 start_codon:yes stop_codon:yes gene_type:complete